MAPCWGATIAAMAGEEFQSIARDDTEGPERKTMRGVRRGEREVGGFWTGQKWYEILTQSFWLESYGESAVGV